MRKFSQMSMKEYQYSVDKNDLQDFSKVFAESHALYYAVMIINDDDEVVGEPFESFARF